MIAQFDVESWCRGQCLTCEELKSDLFGHLTPRCSALSWHKVAETVLALDSQTSAQTTAAKPVLKWLFFWHYKQSCSDCWTCPEMFPSGKQRPNDVLLQPIDKLSQFSTCIFEHIFWEENECGNGWLLIIPKNHSLWLIIIYIFSME